MKEKSTILNTTSFPKRVKPMLATILQARLIKRQLANVIAGFNSIDMNIKNLAAGICSIHNFMFTKRF